MDSLVDCDYSKSKDVQDLMRTLNNLLDWGCLQRKREFDGVLETLKGKQAEERDQQTNMGDESRNKRPRIDKRRLHWWESFYH